MTRFLFLLLTLLFLPSPIYAQCVPVPGAEQGPFGCPPVYYPEKPIYYSDKPTISPPLPQQQPKPLPKPEPTPPTPAASAPVVSAPNASPPKPSQIQISPSMTSAELCSVNSIIQTERKLVLDSLGMTNPALVLIYVGGKIISPRVYDCYAQGSDTSVHTTGQTLHFRVEILDNNVPLITWIKFEN
jgi:hypothetical protein